jgi:hypothetical protein
MWLLLLLLPCCHLLLEVHCVFVMQLLLHLHCHLLLLKVASCRLLV